MSTHWEVLSNTQEVTCGMQTQLQEERCTVFELKNSLDLSTVLADEVVDVSESELWSDEEEEDSESENGSNGDESYDSDCPGRGYKPTECSHRLYLHRPLGSTSPPVLTELEDDAKLEQYHET